MNVIWFQCSAEILVRCIMYSIINPTAEIYMMQYFTQNGQRFWASLARLYDEKKQKWFMQRTVAGGDLKTVLSLWSLLCTSLLSYIPWGNPKTPYCEWIGLGIQQYGSTISLSLWGEFSLSGAVRWTFIGLLFINPVHKKRTRVGDFHETAWWWGLPKWVTYWERNIHQLMLL